MLSDPIAALATAPGRAAVAVVRLSGAGALEVAERVVGDRSGLQGLASRTATLLTLLGADGRPIDRGLVTVYRTPNSYTGEDLVEFACHGGLLVSAELLGALLKAGARQATAGEFTRRAVLNGKLDLLQAEAVADLIDATAPAQRRAALHQLDGGLSKRLLGLREGLLDLLALLAYDIDFPEEDDGPVPAGRIRSALAASAEAIQRLLATAPAGERLRQGALVVLAGRPNTGKSSLFNALLGTDRALVTEIPGTTRDTIEAHTTVRGWPIRLADTAGIREAEDRIEQMGIEVSRRYLAAADQVVLCVEAGDEIGPAEREFAASTPGLLLVRTKADLAPDQSLRALEGIPVSAVSGLGLEHLADALATRLFEVGSGDAGLEATLTQARHRVALEAAAAALAGAAPELERAGDPVLAAHHVREAVARLEELVGLVHPDEVLGRIFERFCVGK